MYTVCKMLIPQLERNFTTCLALLNSNVEGLDIWILRRLAIYRTQYYKVCLLLKVLSYYRKK